MITQMTCPTCGEAHVSVTTHTLDPVSGKQTRGLVNLVLSGSFLAFGACMALFGILVAFTTNVSGALWIYLPIGVLFLVPGGLQLRKYLRAVKVKQFECAGCGHQWSRLADKRESTKCPACGKAEVFTGTIMADRKTGEKVVLLNTILWAVFAIVVIGGGLWMAISIWQEGDTGVIRWRAGSTLAGLGFLALGIGFGRFGVLAVLRYLMADRAKLLIGHCLACGHEWKQWEGAELQAV
jgi:transcription elongation factor Elf1